MHIHTSATNYERGGTCDNGPLFKLGVLFVHYGDFHGRATEAKSRRLNVVILSERSATQFLRRLLQEPSTPEWRNRNVEIEMAIQDW